MDNKNQAGPLDQKEKPPVLGGAISSDENKTDIKKPDEKKKETVEVDKDVLQRILETVEKKGEKIKILTEVADKNRLTRVEELRAQGKLAKKVKLNYFQGKLIIGWAKVKDDVYIDSQGRINFLSNST